MSEFKGINGTPWHVGRFTRKEGDPRRHRAKCYYYISEYQFCAVHNERCYGAAHCNRYKVKEEGQEFDAVRNEFRKRAEKEKTKILRTQPEDPNKSMMCIYGVGSIVEHRIYGRGRIDKIKPGVIIVRFGDLKKMFEYPGAFNHHFLELIKVKDRNREKRKVNNPYYNVISSTKGKNLKPHKKSDKKAKKPIDSYYSDFQKSCYYFSNGICLVEERKCKMKDHCLFYKKRKK